MQSYRDPGIEGGAPAMRRSPREQRMYVLSIAFAAAPFAFGLIRLVNTGSDLRMLWMALASCLGAFAVRSIGKARSRKPSAVLAWAAVTFVIATLFAGVTAFLLGATAGPGASAVACVFGLCWAASYALRPSR